MFKSQLKATTGLALVLSTSTVVAAEVSSTAIMDEITVVGVSGERSAIAGSATRLNSDDLEKFKFQDISRILRMVTGVIIQEEDGYGLRPNIGLRGSGVERSSKITLMEDGVLISPAPYAAPSAYYFPTAARMEAVEVRKGSAAVKFGPRTVGGALNMVSQSIPDDFSGFVDFKYGRDNLMSLHGLAGGSQENFGVVGEFYHTSSNGFKRLPMGQDTGFAVEDYLFKARINTDEDADIYQSLTLKLGKTDHDSDETYLGLTEADFAITPYARYAASALDHMRSDHSQVQLTHLIRRDAFQMITVAYQNDFARDWFKLDDFYVGGNKLKPGAVLDDPASYSDGLAILKGAQDSDIGALRIKHNNREYRSRGVQNIMQFDLYALGADHKVEFSTRYHEDYEDRLQNRENFTMTDGALVFASQEAEGSAGNRISSADAWAFYLSDEITFGNWTLLPGMRFEAIDLKREDFTSPERGTLASAPKEHALNVFIPGFGATYQYSDNLLLMAGIFKGFNPSGPGATNAKEETSLSLEAGFVYDRDGFYGELVAFYSDYSNILGACTASSGSGDCEIGDQFNGGAATVKGLEISAGYDFTVSTSLMIPLKVNYTYTNTSFDSNFSDSFWGDVTAGDMMPYTPAHQLNIVTGLAGEGWSVNMLTNFQTALRTQAGAGPITANEKINGRAIVDINASYQMLDSVTLYGGVQNVFDKKYAVARRPFGLRPGKPLTISGGMKITF